MMRCILFALLTLAVLTGSAFAQFPGYGPSGNAFIGQGNTAPPLWAPIAGDCTLVAAGTITCLKTNGVTFYTGLPTPVNSTDAATKGYVDSTAAALTPHTQALLATAAALPTNTYNNGTAGVGATLTATGNGALTVDGVVVIASNRIVVKNEAAPANNGIYVVTQVGTGGTPYILTRATDANTAGTSDPNKIGAGTYVFVTAGTANTSTGWTVNSTVATIGTSAINWTQFSGGGGVTSLNSLNGALSIVGGTGITITPSGSNVTVSESTARQTLPTTSSVTTGTHTGGFAANGSGTYTTPPNVLWIEILLVGGGAGGCGGSSCATDAGASCWNTTGAACTTPVYSAGGGTGSAGGAIAGTTTCNVAALPGGPGQDGVSTTTVTSSAGGQGGNSTLGGAGVGRLSGSAVAAIANSGSGGAGGGVTAANANSARGGGAGATCKVIINSPAATYTYVVGVGTTGAVASGSVGGGSNGGAGQIVVIEHYGS